MSGIPVVGRIEFNNHPRQDKVMGFLDKMKTESDIRKIISDIQKIHQLSKSAGNGCEIQRICEKYVNKS